MSVHALCLRHQPSRAPSQPRRLRPHLRRQTLDYLHQGIAPRRWVLKIHPRLHAFLHDGAIREHRLQPLADRCAGTALMSAFPSAPCRHAPAPRWRRPPASAALRSAYCMRYRHIRKEQGWGQAATAGRRGGGFLSCLSASMRCVISCAHLPETVTARRSVPSSAATEPSLSRSTWYNGAGFGVGSGCCGQVDGSIILARRSSQA